MFSHRNLSLYGGHDDEINSLVFSHDFQILLTGSINGCIRLWNTVYHRLIFKIQEQRGCIRALAISNNDKYFASISNDADIRLYKTRTGRVSHILYGHTHASDCLHFSFDSQLIASGAWDCRTIVWNVITGEQLYNFSDHTNAVQSISFHPNRNIMATGSHDHLIFLYDLDKPLLLNSVALRGHFNNIRALAFSHLPYLASAGWDKIIVIWHIETLCIRSRLFGHTGWIEAISFSDENGSILASVDNDTVCVWNIFNSLCLHRLTIVNDISCSVRFLPNNKGILVGGAVFELLANQSISSRERTRTKRIRESITGETKLISLPKQLYPNRSVKLPVLKCRSMKR